jgi:hypothetical protein
VCAPAMWLAVLQARQAVLFIACAAFYERRLVKHLALYIMQCDSCMQTIMHCVHAWQMPLALHGTDAKQPNQHGIEQRTSCDVAVPIHMHECYWAYTLLSLV